MEYSVGYAVTEEIRDAIKLIPKKVWTPASDADGGIREGGDVAELTGLLDLTAWPVGMRLIVRRERPHPGAQLSLFEESDGALPSDRDQHHHRTVGASRGPSPCPRPRRGPDPDRQSPLPLPGAELRNDTPPLPDALAAMAGAVDSVRLEIDGIPRSLPPAVGLALLRTAQEGLLNVRKHAAGTTTSLQLRYGVDHVELIVSNAECGGFGPEAARRGAAENAGVVGGHGLAGMRERLLLVGGSLTAGPVAGGWAVHAEAPG